MTIDRKRFLNTLLAAAGAATAGLQTACRRQPAGTPAASPASAAPSRSEKLMEKIVTDMLGAATAGAAFIGDSLGLFKAMDGKGPMAAAQLAIVTKLNQRYVEEWLRAMATSGYLEYHPETRSFELPAEYRDVLVNEDSPVFSIANMQGVIADLWMIPKVMAAFRSGKGISYAEYPPETFQAIERGTRPDYLHALTQQWLPAVPGLVEKLKAGCSAADLGSGAGVASIALARAFPKVRAFGYEPYAPSVARATENAKIAGLSDRVSFHTFDGLHVPGGPYGLITMNFALHHAGDPAAVLRSAKQALDRDGVMLLVEFRRSERLEQDIDTIRRFSYSAGLLECLPTALAEGGPGYGTGMQESEVKRLAAATGFRDCRTILADDPFRLLCVLKP